MKAQLLPLLALLVLPACAVKQAQPEPEVRPVLVALPVPVSPEYAESMELAECKENHAGLGELVTDVINDLMKCETECGDLRLMSIQRAHDMWTCDIEFCQANGWTVISDLHLPPDSREMKRIEKNLKAVRKAVEENRAETYRVLGGGMKYDFEEGIEAKFTRLTFFTMLNTMVLYAKEFEAAGIAGMDDAEAVPI